MNMNFNTSPLPFQGQKRRFVKAFKNALNGYSDTATYIDLFGGSGLLAHTVKQKYPNARVIWNDYDNFLNRINAIPQTNLLLRELRAIVEGYPRKERLSSELKETLLKAIKAHHATHGFVDYITISSSLLFSSKYATTYEQLEKETFYGKIKMSDYDAGNYLEGVERVQTDYKLLHKAHTGPDVVYLVDPPYLSTDTSTYGSDDYWKLRDYLDVLSVLDGSSYFYFTSNKSQVVELCDWIETRTLVSNPFAGSTVTTTSNSVNYNSSYTDIMLYK